MKLGELLIKAREFGGEALVRQLETLCPDYPYADVIDEIQQKGLITEAQATELKALL